MEETHATTVSGSGRWAVELCMIWRMRSMVEVVEAWRLRKIELFGKSLMLSARAERISEGE